MLGEAAATQVDVRPVITVAVGSTNRVKIASVEAAFSLAFSHSRLDVRGFKAQSGVPDQPRSDTETKQGAANRARRAATLWTDEDGSPPDFSVGLEGGVAEEPTFSTLGVGDDHLESFAWMAVVSRKGQWGFARTASFQLPPAVAELVRGGMELGDADDKVFSRRGSKTQEGAVGILTHGLITRATYYEHPLVLALAPFCNPDLF